ncbi:hypothetical protein ECBCE008MS13_1696 [Escherichia coli BCE008_MS-13]|nr:hypothetical protein ECBCE008MS13_1696 [Escherichia coli BCE008_MS-13]
MTSSLNELKKIPFTINAGINAIIRNVIVVNGDHVLMSS